MRIHGTACMSHVILCSLSPQCFRVYQVDVQQSVIWCCCFSVWQHAVAHLVMWYHQVHYTSLF